MIPTGQHSDNTQSLDQIETYYCRTDTFKNSFFPYTIVEWNKLDLDIQKPKSYAIFRNALLKIDQPNQCSVYIIHNPMGLKLLSRLRIVLATSMNIDLIMILETVLTLYVVVALQLNQRHIFYCTAIISQIFAQLS